MYNQRFPDIKPYLKTHSLMPENQETPIAFIKKDIVENPLFYRRNHFPYPMLSSSFYWLPINGAVKEPKLFSMQELIQFPAKKLKVVLECAGDKRSFFEPKVYGEQWGNGGISQGYWKGVPLKALLEQTGLKDDAKEVIVEGYDYGKQPGIDGIHRFARSLPLEKALHPDTIIAYEYNHQPIPFKHGYPLRLIVPGWYAMASVKWVRQITVIDSHFNGPFQSIDYVYYPHKDNNNDSFPVTNINVNSTIQKPNNMQILNAGRHTIKGIAWTGKGTIQRVEISTDNGQTWSYATIKSDHRSQYEWVSWSYEWVVSEKGEYTIMSKATDSYHQTQPMSPFWNRKGYGYNAADCIRVKVE
ncbi:sulfite oxidase [Heyndrickxia shackletonii]|uniref:Sulfite oxidase n=1 Tax=Heyndrickxia shackletonii TaxID=157838 RepID=A0A0Q3TAZ4_9BACI|nr:sulfite oxidase [Heyndrickxia shackletonii]KQL51246.1 sulfite oxidase [Heyndrickxia shackletonii]NEY98485.1 sulfite oxidase [Heyndrickxia shackletonii]